MVLPVHDVQPPKEVVEAPSPLADGGDPSGVRRHVESCHVIVGTAQSPRRKRTAVSVVAFVTSDARAMPPAWLRQASDLIARAEAAVSGESRLPLRQSSDC